MYLQTTVVYEKKKYIGYTYALKYCRINPLTHLSGRKGAQLGCPRNKNKNSVQTEACFRCVPVCFIWCFEPTLKQPKQTEVFRNNPEQL